MLACSAFIYCYATADILTKLLQQCFLFFIVVVMPGQYSGERLQDHWSYSGYIDISVSIFVTILKTLSPWYGQRVSYCKLIF